MNYKVIHDGEYSSIEGTEEAANEDTEIFTSFSKAKAVLIEAIQDRIIGLRECQSRVRALRKNQVEKNDD